MNDKGLEKSWKVPGCAGLMYVIQPSFTYSYLELRFILKLRSCLIELMLRNTTFNRIYKPIQQNCKSKKAADHFIHGVVVNKHDTIYTNVNINVPKK